MIGLTAAEFEAIRLQPGRDRFARRAALQPPAPLDRSVADGMRVIGRAALTRRAPFLSAFSMLGSAHSFAEISDLGIAHNFATIGPRAVRARYEFTTSVQAGHLPAGGRWLIFGSALYPGAECASTPAATRMRTERRRNPPASTTDVSKDIDVSKLDWSQLDVDASTLDDRREGAPRRLPPIAA